MISVKGSVVKNIWSLAVPMTVAQLVNVLYSVVDRVYIGHLPHTSTEALTGIGLALPVITMITAFSNLFGMGGVTALFDCQGSGRRRTGREDHGKFFYHVALVGCGIDGSLLSDNEAHALFVSEQASRRTLMRKGI